MRYLVGYNQGEFTKFPVLLTCLVKHIKCVAGAEATNKYVSYFILHVKWV